MDREMIIRGCEYWVKNHKDESLLLAYSSVVELLALLKEQEETIRNLEQEIRDKNDDLSEVKM